MPPSPTRAALSPGTGPGLVHREACEASRSRHRGHTGRRPNAVRATNAAMSRSAAVSRMTPPMQIGTQKQLHPPNFRYTLLEVRHGTPWQAGVVVQVCSPDRIGKASAFFVMTHAVAMEVAETRDLDARLSWVGPD